MKRVEIKLVINSELPKYTITDKRRLKQILINLLNNAINYTITGYIKLIVDFNEVQR